MKTKIVVLLVFLVFLSLSCQKDSGVESAGNKTQKDNMISKKKSFQNEDHIIQTRYHAHVRIYQDNHDGEEEHKVVDTVIASNLMHYPTPFVSVTFPTLPGNAGTTFHANFEFSWQNCCACNLYTSAVGVFCEFIIGIYLEEGKDDPGWHQLMQTSRTKPYGIQSGTESIDYPILYTYPHKLEPDKDVGKYNFTVIWTQNPEVYNYDYPCTNCLP